MFLYLLLVIVLIIYQHIIIQSISIDGTGNDLTLENNIKISAFTISGTGNTINIRLDSGISYIDSGTGNTLIEY